MNVYYKLDENVFKVGQLFSTNEDISLVRLYNGSNPILGLSNSSEYINEKKLRKSFIISKTLFEAHESWPESVFYTSNSTIPNDDSHPFIVSTILLRRSFYSSYKKSKQSSATKVFFTKQMWESVFGDVQQKKKRKTKQNGFLYFRFKQTPQENNNIKIFLETILQIYGLKRWEEAEEEALSAGYFHLVSIGKYSQYVSARKKILKLIDQSNLSEFVRVYYHCPTSRRDEIKTVEFEGNEEIEELNGLIGKVSKLRTRKALFLIEDRRKFDPYTWQEKCKVLFYFNSTEMTLKIEFKYFVRSPHY